MDFGTAGTILETPEQLEMLRLRTLHMALKCKLRSGMNLTRINPLPIARQYGCKAKTHKSALAELEEKFPFLKK